MCQVYTVYLILQAQRVLEPSYKSRLRRLKHSQAQAADLVKAAAIDLDSSGLILAEEG